MRAFELSTSNKARDTAIDVSIRSDPNSDTEENTAADHDIECNWELWWNQNLVSGVESPQKRKIKLILNSRKFLVVYFCYKTF